MSRHLPALALVACSLLIPAACSKRSSKTEHHPIKNAPDTAAQAAKEQEAALTAITDCMENVDLNIGYWEDAFQAASGKAAECPVVIMKMRHLASLFEHCRELAESATKHGIPEDKVAARVGNLTSRLKDVQDKLLPDSKLLGMCKKWSAKPLADPIEGPPSTSIPDGRCPTYGQIMRDAQNRYNSACRYLGTCSHKLQVAGRVPDPYDKTRCDTSVKFAGNTFISALYRKYGGNWQLEAIN